MSRLHKPGLLIVGCGDVGMRLLPWVRQRFRVIAVTSQAARCDVLRAAGAVPLVADLDCRATLDRLTSIAHTIVHLAPPQAHGVQDCRTRRLVTILPDGARLVYVSTSGVYGDCNGASIDETRAVAPHNARARRRLDAEEVLRAWGRRSGSRVSILRVPGIYANDRLPLTRLRNGSPALREEEDVYTNHIHADDLARIVALTIFRGCCGRVYHAVDDSQMKMADYFDAVADACSLPRPPRLPRTVLAGVVSPMLLSFMSESRRLENTRLKHELGIRLQYPTVRSMLAELPPLLEITGNAQ